MEATSSPPMPFAQRLDLARQMAIELARLASATRCQDVAVLDVSRLSPVTDFFVIATGTSPRQMRTVCDHATELAEKMDFRPLSTCGYDSQSWVLADFVDVVLHIFSQEARLYYDLDGLWGDAPRVAWEPPGGTTASGDAKA